MNKKLCATFMDNENILEQHVLNMTMTVILYHCVRVLKRVDSQVSFHREITDAVKQKKKEKNKLKVQR